ncbi:MAG: hypothetical protein ACRDT2_02540 [Natronosporangium sp.]
MKHRRRSRREAARLAGALQRAMSTTSSRAVRDEMLASLGR